MGVVVQGIKDILWGGFGHPRSVSLPVCLLLFLVRSVFLSDLPVHIVNLVQLFPFLGHFCCCIRWGMRYHIFLFLFQSFEASNRGQSSCRCTLDQWVDLIGVITSWETKYFKQEPIQRRFHFSGVLYISAGQTSPLQVQWEFTLDCFYVHIYSKWMLT